MVSDEPAYKTTPVMKKYPALFLLAFLCFNLPAQSLLDEVGNSICECFERKLLVRTDLSLQALMDDCAEVSYDQYLEQLIKELEIDTSQREAMQDLGKEFGKAVQQHCPAHFLHIVRDNMMQVPRATVKGHVLKLVEDGFMHLVILNEQQERISLVILSEFPEAIEKINEVVGEEAEEAYHFVYEETMLFNEASKSFETYLMLVDIEPGDD